jgi:hypothetical protein
MVCELLQAFNLLNGTVAKIFQELAVTVYRLGAFNTISRSQDPLKGLCPVILPTVFCQS